MTYAWPRCEICQHAEWGGKCNLTERPVNWVEFRESDNWPYTDYSNLCDQFIVDQSVVDYLNRRYGARR